FLHFQFAAEQFDDCQISAITFSVTELDDAAVSAIPVGEAGCDAIEYFFRNGFTKEICLEPPARMKVVTLAESDHSFGQWTNFFCLWKRGHQPSVIEKVRNQISEHCPPM